MSDSVWRPLREFGCALGAAALVSMTCAPARSAAAPEPASPGSATAVANLKACRALEDGTARLSCYDSAVDAFSKAEAEGHIAVVDSEKISAVRRQTFGFSFPAINLFAGSVKSQSVDKVTLTVIGAGSDGNGRWLMSTSQGATWRLTEAMQYGDPPHSGSSLEVRRGSLVSFFCKIDGNPGVRCRREQ